MNMPFTTLATRLVALILLWLPGVASASQEVVIELQLEPPHLDPTLTPSATTAEVTYFNVFQGLVHIGEQGDILPALAKAWEVSDDGLRYRFELREGVSFHDSRGFDAEVAAYNLRRLNDPVADNPQRHLYRAIESVEVLDERRIELQLDYPDSLLPFRLGLSSAVMVHPERHESHQRHPIGTGPYRFVEWNDQRITLEAFDGYWGDAPMIRHAQFRFTPNRLEQEAALREGKIDLYPDVSGLAPHQQLAERNDYLTLERMSESQVIVSLNHDHPALGDLRVRRALSHAVNRDKLMGIYQGITPIPIGSHFSPRHPAYVDLVDRYPHSPERARELLAEAGYAEGLSLTLTLPPTQYAQQASLHVADDLEAVGITVEIERIGWAEWLTQVFTARDYDMTIISHVEPLDIDIYARDDYYFNYHSQTFAALWEKIQQASGRDEQYRLLEEAQRMVADDAVNLFLFLKPQLAIHKSALGGVWANQPIPAVILHQLYWK